MMAIPGASESESSSTEYLIRFINYYLICMPQKYNMKKLSGSLMLVVSVLLIQAQERTLTGTVKTNTGQPVEKATVHLVNTMFSNATNANGSFSIPFIPR